MTDKLNNTDKNPVTEFASVFVSDPKVVKKPADYANYDGFHLAPLNDYYSSFNVFLPYIACI